MLEERFAHALFDSDRRRPADHDGATRSLRSVVLHFRLEDQVPENHLLRSRGISVLEFVCELLRASYSETRRPSIDPELLLRIVLVRNLLSWRKILITLIYPQGCVFGL